MKKSSLFYECGCTIRLEMIAGTVRDTWFNLCTFHSNQLINNTFDVEREE